MRKDSKGKKLVDLRERGAAFSVQVRLCVRVKEGKGRGAICQV